MLFALMAGCGNNSKPSETTEDTTPATPAGTLYVTLNNTLELVYDQDGNILELKGTDADSNAIAADLQMHLGRGCVHAVRGFMRYVSDRKIIGDAKSMTVRVGFGDPLPTADFLDTITVDTQMLADEEGTGVQIHKISADKLDSAGLILPEVAKILAARRLSTTAETLTGEDTVVDGQYTYSFAGKTCTVNATTGLITAK